MTITEEDLLRRIFSLEEKFKKLEVFSEIIWTKLDTINERTKIHTKDIKLLEKKLKC